MVFEVESRKPVAEIDAGLHEAAARHGFGVPTVHNLRETMQRKGVDFQGECVIYEVCNPYRAKAVLEANPVISTALPCRISLYHAGEAYRLATILPTAMMRMFDTPQVESVAREVEDIVVAIMKEAA